MPKVYLNMHVKALYRSLSNCRGVIPGGAGGATAPQLLANNTFFCVFSHTTDRKVPSEVVLMGSFMSVVSHISHIAMVMSDKSAIVQLKNQ